MLKYILIDAGGKIFDTLVKNISSHSLTDLLIELMQLNVISPQSAATHINLSRGSNDDEDETQTTEADQAPNVDHDKMKAILDFKKRSVVQNLIKKMSHTNSSDMEASLNASTVLIELIEIEKTFEIFWTNEAELIGKIIELAIDPSNNFNQQYLLKVLLAIAKQVKPQNASKAQNLFKDLEDDNDGDSNASDKNVFDPESANGKNLLQFLNLIKKSDMIYNLMVLINSKDTDEESPFMSNQNNISIRKIGQIRIRSLELLQHVFALMHGTLGKLAKANILLQGAADPDESVHQDLHVVNYLNTQQRRQLLQTLLAVLREYGHCSIACQLCILILDQTKNQLDVIDIVSLQKFVLHEFSQRHEFLSNMHRTNKESENPRVIKRYQLDHHNMQSAQVNQLTIQLKDKIAQLQNFFSDAISHEQRESILGENYTNYHDLISSEEKDFWTYLCNKDFKRLQKLLVRNLGEGHFFDDSESDDSDEPHKVDSDEEDGRPAKRRFNVQSRNRYDASPQDQDDDDEEEGHDNFMDRFLAEMQAQQAEDGESAEDLQKQIEEEEQKERDDAALKERQFDDHQFWEKPTGDYDLDALLEDYEG